MNSNVPSIPARVRSFCTRFIQTPCSIVVAVSGGADSVGLLHLLCQIRADLGIRRLGVAHVNHNLRGEASDKDMEFVRELARTLGVPFYCRNLDSSEKGQGGLENWGRRCRYEFFAKLRESERYDYIATGHTADDQAETVLMRFLRGAGTGGRAGIRPVRDDGVIRPFLYVWKEELIRWLLAGNAGFRTDESNWDQGFERNRVRHAILPLLRKRSPDAVQVLAGIAEVSREIEERAGAFVNKWERSYVYELAEDTFEVDRGGFRVEFLANRGLYRCFQKREIPFDRSHIGGVRDNLRKKGRAFLLPGNWEYLIGRDRIRFREASEKNELESARTEVVVPGSVSIENGSGCISADVVTAGRQQSYRGESNWSACVDAKKAGTTLVIRRSELADQFCPLGGTILHPLRRYLKKQGLAAFERETRLVVATPDGSIIWIPGVQIADDFRVTSQTGSVLELSYQKM